MSELVPEIGEVKQGWAIGHKCDSPLIWQACDTCGKQRWVRLGKGKPVYTHCFRCARLGNFYHFKDGRYQDRNGYIWVWLHPDDFFHGMVKRNTNYISEHRLVMAKYLGRCLHSWEIVHHKNHVKDDNRAENLQLVSDDRHRQITILEQKIRRLEERVEEQGKLIRLLQWQRKQEVMV